MLTCLHSPTRRLGLHRVAKAGVEAAAGGRVSACSPAQAGRAGAAVAGAGRAIGLVAGGGSRARRGGQTLLVGQHAHHAPAALQRGSHHCRVKTESPKVNPTTTAAQPAAITAVALTEPTSPEPPSIHHLPTIIVFGLGVGDVHADAFDDQVLPA